jgi:hypothetical protein
MHARQYRDPCAGIELKGQYCRGSHAEVDLAASGHLRLRETTCPLQIADVGESFRS